MKRIGVTGATGFIGTALVKKLLARGDEVVAFSRSSQPPASLQARVEQLDVLSPNAVGALTAALEGLDAVVHLAGALGKPVWILLHYAADWRWLIDRSDSPWYPTARLFRQPRLDDWEYVIGQVRTELMRI